MRQVNLCRGLVAGSAAVGSAGGGGERVMVRALEQPGQTLLGRLACGMGERGRGIYRGAL